MTFPDIIPDIRAAAPDLRGRLLANQPLAPLTWFRVGGPAQVLFTPADEEDLAYLLAHLPAAIDVTVIVPSTIGEGRPNPVRGELREVLTRMAEVTGIALGIVSVGPNRDETIVLAKDIF